MAAAQPLLVPFDGSRPALRALDYAIALAAPAGARLHVLNVQAREQMYASVRAGEWGEDPGRQVALQLTRLPVVLVR